MALDSTDITNLETKIEAVISADQSTSVRDAIGNEISYNRPKLADLSAFYDWLNKKTTKSARTSMFDKCRFSAKD